MIIRRLSLRLQVSFKDSVPVGAKLTNVVKGVIAVQQLNVLDCIKFPYVKDNKAKGSRVRISS